MITTLADFEVWFVTGSQHLYGEETLQKVNQHSQEIVHHFNDQDDIPVKIIFKPVVTTPDEIYNLAREAEYHTNCIGWICWMHTFSPAKMWINALKHLRKPFLHLHTQYNEQIPWASIDMDFMILNQSAHGDREFGFIASRMNKHRKVVVGHWKDEEAIKKIGRWARVAAAWADSQSMKVARIGDNMRHVAVTEDRGFHRQKPIPGQP